jgi:hypothetical protein
MTLVCVRACVCVYMCVCHTVVCNVCGLKTYGTGFRLRAVRSNWGVFCTVTALLSTVTCTVKLGFTDKMTIKQNRFLGVEHYLYLFIYALQSSLMCCRVRHCYE